MAKASPLLANFNAGELAPELEGRVDLGKYANGAKLLQNFMPLVQGPARRRAGSRYVAGLKSSASRAWLFEFEFSTTQAFMLEFGDRYVRFYTLHGQLQVSGVAAYNGATAYVVGDLASNAGINYYCIAPTTGNAPPNATYWYALAGVVYEIPTPYLLADLTSSEGSFALKIEQSGDVLYIAHPAYPPYTLTRYGTTNWQLAIYQPSDGPFLEANTSATTIYASASTGSVTLTASAAVFAASDVGRLVRLDVRSFNVKPWETNIAWALNDLCRFNGKTYKALNAATSGTAPPVHQVGSAFDGKTGVQWAYQDSGYGIARITAYTSSTAVTASVITDDASGLQQFPSDVVGSGNATTRWRLGAWSGTSEYPRAVKFWRDRLWWAGKLRLWASVPGLYTSMSSDFFGQVTTDSAIYAQMSASQVNNIAWLIAGERLFIGTAGGEFAAGEITTVDPVGPANFKIERQSKKRVRGIQPEIVGTSILYVQRSARKVFAMDYDIAIDRFRSSDQTLMAYHMTKSGIVDMAYQSEPYSILWCVLADGSLVALTYDAEQDVRAWHRHPIGGNGVVEAVATMPAPDSGRDEVWIIVKRTINGTIARFVEYLEKPWEQGDAQSDVFYVDAGATYSGPAATTISGLDYLEGQTVQVVVNGAAHPDRIVVGGQISLQVAGTKVQVGLQSSAQWISMRLESGAFNGTSQGKLKRTSRAAMRFIDTIGGFYGMENGPLDEFEFRDPATPMDGPPAIFSGDKIVSFPGDWESDSRLTYRQDQPFPVTLAGVYPITTTNEP
jgi:hypothetical protein